MTQVGPIESNEPFLQEGIFSGGRQRNRAEGPLKEIPGMRRTYATAGSEIIGFKCKDQGEVSKS